MKINYQIMKESQKSEGKYYPNYKELINNATSKEEQDYINKVQNDNFGFAYNMVYITKQKCGHYEIFQTPQNEYYSLEDNLKNAKEHALTMKCTHCICNQ